MKVVHPEPLAAMRKLGGTWAAYVNVALDSSNAGHLQYLAFGPGREGARLLMLILDTPLTPALKVWLERAADDGRALSVREVAVDASTGRRGPDIEVDAPGGLTSDEMLEVHALLAAHSVEPLQHPLP